MSKKCPPSYRNLNTIKSYSDQKYATVQWCEQNCENDEWLKQQVDELSYLSPPAVRKRFKISEYIDLTNSYGANAVENGKVIFDNSTQKRVYVDFSDATMDYVDKVKSENSNVIFTSVKSTTNSTDSDDESVVHRCELKKEIYGIPPSYDYFGSYEDGMGINSYWYLAYNKDRPYKLYSAWLKDWKSQGIPAVSRAQTFKVPSGKGGFLESVDVRLQYNGNKSTVTGSPLYVQLWKTYWRFDRKSKWDNKKKQMVYSRINYTKLPNESDATQEQKDKWQYKEKYSKYAQYVKTKDSNNKTKWVKLTKKNKSKYPETGNNKYDRYVWKREKIHWLGHNKQKGTDKNGKKTYYSDIRHPLSEGVFERTGDTTPTIVFDKPYKVEEGKYYALVFSSPLSVWQHCPRLGGWGRNCKNDKKYNQGYAFLSENNGKTWIRYGKNDDDLIDEQKKTKQSTYKKGKYTPQDYAFRVKVRTGESKQVEYRVFDEDNYLYLKPILSNPIKSVEIYGTASGDVQSDSGNKGHVIYQVSTDGDNWTDVANNSILSFEEEYKKDGYYPRVLMVRAKMYRDTSVERSTLYAIDEDTEERTLAVDSDDVPLVNNDSWRNDTPTIENLTVMLNTLPATEMYARTSKYTPKTTPMLGANLWGKVYAPFTTQDTVTCTAEIIKGDTYTQHIILCGLNSVEEYMEKFNDDDKTVVDGTNSLNNIIGVDFDKNIIADIKELDGEERAQYLTTNNSIIEDLKKHNIYIKPYDADDELYLLSFSKSYSQEDMVITKDETTNEFKEYSIGGIRFNNIVAYPILSVRKQDPSTSDGEVDAFSEWIDYTFDYETNELIFKKRVITDPELTTGDLYITYNPVFIEGLTADEVGVHKDTEGNTTGYGLVLDYFKENIDITGEMVETRRVGLRVQPTDPIRQVRLYKADSNEGDEPLNLLEDDTYILDSNTNELVFNVTGTDGSNISVLGVGDVLEVVYTPWLEDDTLMIGYFAKRGNVDKQCEIDDVYFEYKV